MEFSAISGGRTEVLIVSGGKREFMNGSVAACTSSGELSWAKSKTGNEGGTDMDCGGARAAS
jgi:hypothetical protein